MDDIREPLTMRTIAVINQKGGCGKTTISINLAAALANKGKRTLLVDMDPQGHCAVGLAVPEDLAVIGFDDIPFASFPEVQLSTIGQPKYEMGKTAVEMLIADIEAGLSVGGANGRRVILEPELIVRRSSA